MLVRLIVRGLCDDAPQQEALLADRCKPVRFVTLQKVVYPEQGYIPGVSFSPYKGIRRMVYLELLPVDQDDFLSAVVSGKQCIRTRCGDFRVLVTKVDNTDPGTLIFTCKKRFIG